MSHPTMINIANNNGIEFIPLILANVYGPYDPSNRFIKNIPEVL